MSVFEGKSVLGFAIAICWPVVKWGNGCNSSMSNRGGVVSVFCVVLAEHYAVVIACFGETRENMKVGEVMKPN